MLYLLEFVMSIVWPFFRHDTIGSGDPFGGPHSSITVSPCATRVFCGSSRNSSRSTGTKKSVMGLVQVPKLLIKLWITMEIIIKRNYVYKSRISLSCSVIQFANKTSEQPGEHCSSFGIHFKCSLFYVGGNFLLFFIMFGKYRLPREVFLSLLLRRSLAEGRRMGGREIKVGRKK